MNNNEPAPVPPTDNNNKYSLTRGTRAFIGAGVILVIAAISVVITTLAVQLSESNQELLQNKAQISELKLQYDSLYTEYRDVTGVNPDSPSPAQVDRLSGLQGVNGETCPVDSKYGEVTLTTAANGTITFFACKV